MIYEENLTEEDIQNIIKDRYEVDRDNKVLKIFVDGKIIVDLGGERVVISETI